MIFAALAAAAAVACAGQPRTAAGVLATEQEWVRAIETHDSKLLSCILAPEFADTSWRGEVIPRATVLARLPSHPPATLKLSGLSVVLEGRFAIVHGTNTQLSPDGRTSGSVRFTDMFVYRAGTWRALSAQETPIAKE